MLILVTGGAGYIGSHTVKQLKQAGHSVVVFDSLENGHRESLPGLVENKDLFVGNLLDTYQLASVFKQFKFDAVIHFAAYALVAESVEDPGTYFQNNTAGTINLLHQMTKAGVHKLIFSSTCAIFGQPEVVPIHESLPKKPTSPYGHSKLLSEAAIEAMTQWSPLKATCLRYFNASGADLDGSLGENHPTETHLIPLVLQVALGGREAIKIFGTDYPTPDGTAIRDYIHVTDLADAHIAALEAMPKNESKFNAYNVGTGQGYSVKEVINMCRQITQHPIPATEEARRAGDPAELIADPKKIMQGLNWQPKHSDLKTITTTAWAWQQKHPHGYAKKNTS